MIRGRNRARGGSGAGGTSIPFVPTDDPNLVMYRYADNPDNVTTTLNVSFTPTDVNTITNKITVALPAGQFVRGNPYNASRVTYSTTGTPIGGLTNGSEYVLQDNGDGTASLSPIVSDSDFALLASYEEGETIDPYQAYACEIYVDFTSQGSGTHSFTSQPFLTLIADASGNSIGGVPATGTLNSAFRLITDGNGVKYIEHEGCTGRGSNNDDRYGKLYNDNVSSAVLEALLPLKRYHYAAISMEYEYNRHFSIQRVFLTPDRVNTGTGVLTGNNHGLITGNAVNLDVLSTGGAFPTPTIAFAGTVYSRSVSATTFTLHPTALDATNNTNKYVYSNTGTGVFCVTDPTQCQTEAATRQMIFDVCVETGNGHDFSPIEENYIKIINVTTSSVWGDGSSGLLFGLFPSTDIGRNFTALEVEYFCPSGSALIATDTGLPLENGFYWINSADSASNCYLYRTEALAIGGVSGDRIKYNKAASNGEVMFSLKDKGTFRNFGDGFQYPSTYPLIDYGTYGVFCLIVDFEDAGGLALFTAGLDGVNNLLNAAVSAASYPSGLTNGGDVKILQGNTNEPHVASKAKVRAMVFGASDTEPTAILEQHLAFLQAQYPTPIS